LPLRWEAEKKCVTFESFKYSSQIQLDSGCFCSDFSFNFESVSGISFGTYSWDEAGAGHWHISQNKFTGFSFIKVHWSQVNVFRSFYTEPNRPLFIGYYPNNPPTGGGRDPNSPLEKGFGGGPHDAGAPKGVPNNPLLGT
jgi:hypothetical protein